MALPLPRVVADVGPGGPLVTSMGGINSLANDMNLRKISSVKAKYAPLTTQAEAASKLAYANLMAPQFLAKLMGNSLAMGNLSDDQIKKLISSVYSAGTGEGTGQNIFSRMQQENMGEGEKLGNKFSDFLSGHIRNIFGNEQKQPNFQGQANPLSRPDMGLQQQSMRNQSPSSNAEIGTRRPENGVLLEGQQWYDKDGNPVYDQGEVSVPGEPTVEMELNTGVHSGRQRTPAEKAGDYEGIIKEGADLGAQRVISKKELDQDYQQALQLKAPFQKLNSIIKTPAFQNLRKIPGFQKLQMNVKANIGSQEEQKLIGAFQAAAQNVVAATVKGFGGRILASEIPLAESMKLNQNDTIDVMLGKAPVIESFNEMTLQRSRLASKLMKEYHLDKGDALEKADQMVDGDAIRKQVENEFESPITDEDIDTTAREMGMTREQVIQRLKSEGRYNG